MHQEKIVEKVSLYEKLPSASSDAADYSINKLDQWAIDDLKKSGLTDETIAKLGCFSVRSNEDLLALVGFANMNGKPILEQAEAAYAIPYNDGSNFVRIKLKTPIVKPNGSLAKYLSPLKQIASPWHVYYMPDENSKFSKRKGCIIIVEGEKKAIKTAQDLAAAGDTDSIVIGIPGITLWQEWKEWHGNLRIAGRSVYIALDAHDYGDYDGSNFDNNTAENIDVETQAMKLWLFLRTQKKVKNAFIIDWDHKEKGIDDYLVANPGTIKSIIDTASPNPFEVLPLFKAANGYEHLAPIVVSLFLSKQQYKAIWEELQLSDRFHVSFDTFNHLIAENIKKSDKKEQPKEEPQGANKHESIVWISPKGKVLPAAAAVAFARANQHLIYNQETESFWAKKQNSWRQILDDQVFCYITAFIGKDNATTHLVNDIMNFLKAIFVEATNLPAVDISLCFINGQGKVLPKFAAIAFLKQLQGNLVYVNSKFWQYDIPQKGIWQAVSDSYLLGKISNMIEAKKVTLAILRDVLENVRFLLSEEQSKTPITFNAQAHLLCFTNCVLDTLTMQILPHDRNFYQTIQFPYDLPGTVIMSQQELVEHAPNWFKFLKSLKFEPDTLQRLQEWFGYGLVPVTTMERCLYLKGKGSNGKSTMLEVLTNLVGRTQVSHIPPTKLFEPFQLCGIEGKLVNISGDIATNVVFDEQFKDVVTGTEQTTQAKYRDSFNFKPYVRFIFSANNYIPSRDHSEGFYRRFDIVEFTQKFSKEKGNIDRELGKKLLAELPYIVVWAIQGLERMRNNHWEFTDSKQFAQAKSKFEIASDNVRDFMITHFTLTGDEDDSLETKSLRSLYVEWCRERNHQPMAENRLGQEILALSINGYSVGNKRVRSKMTGKLEHAYTGIRLSKYDDPIPDQDVQEDILPTKDQFEMTPEEQEFFDERVAIMQMDGKMTEKQAQLKAQEMIAELRRNAS